MLALLPEIQPALSAFFGRVLPSIESDDGWDRYVIQVLWFAQRNRLLGRQITSIMGLDLALLLQVVDRNWTTIRQRAGLTPEVRNYLKETQSIRNRCAHASIEEVPVADVYRDLDTLLRLARAIDAKDSLIDRIQLQITEVEQEKFGGGDATASPSGSSEFVDLGVKTVKSRPSVPDPAVSGMSTTPGAQASLGASAPGRTFSLTLSKTYYDKGFFNVWVNFEQHVRRDSGPVDLRVGRAGLVVAGKVSRTANANGTPRVFGGASLRDWLQENFRQGNLVVVQLLTPTEIWIGPDA